MGKRQHLIIAICLLLVLSSCGQRQGEVDQENHAAQELPSLSPVTSLSIPADFHYDNFVSLDHTLFLHGTGNNGPAFFCIDMETDTISDIKLPVSGPVLDLSVSNGGACLATVYSSRLDETGTPRGHFTLFEIGRDALVRKQVELAGIDRINLLAIGTPVVNGCAVLNDRILIIVNNRVVLLDDDGKLIDSVIMDSVHPRIAGASAPSACIYDVVDGKVSAALLSVSQENELSVRPMDCPPSCADIIPTAAGDSIFVVQDNTVYSCKFELQNNRMRPAWIFPYGYSGEKKFFYDGEETLLECYNGRVAVYRIQ